MPLRNLVTPTKEGCKELEAMTRQVKTHATRFINAQVLCCVTQAQTVGTECRRCGESAWGDQLCDRIPQNMRNNLC
jgi:hypothetical protein